MHYIKHQFTVEARLRVTIYSGHIAKYTHTHKTRD
jgi:hypothetical protein